VILKWIDAREQRPQNDDDILFIEKGHSKGNVGIYYDSDGDTRVDFSPYFDDIPWSEIVWWMHFPKAPELIK